MLPTRRRLRIPFGHRGRAQQLEDAIAKAEAEKRTRRYRRFVEGLRRCWPKHKNRRCRQGERHFTEVRDAISVTTEVSARPVGSDGKKPGAVTSDTGAAVFGVAGTVVLAAGIALTYLAQAYLTIVKTSLTLSQ